MLSVDSGVGWVSEFCERNPTFFVGLRSKSELTQPTFRVLIVSAGIAQLVEHNLAKVGVASSSLVSRSIFCPAGWQSGHAAACKAVDAGSIPASASSQEV